MSLKAMNWATCETHGRQIHESGQCVSCRKPKPVHRPSIINQPITARFYAMGRPRSVFLTPTEWEVASRYATGMTTREIAEELGKSKSTVQKALYSGRWRLGVYGLDELVVKVRTLTGKAA